MDVGINASGEEDLAAAIQSGSALGGGTFPHAGDFSILYRDAALKNTVLGDDLRIGKKMLHSDDHSSL